MDFTPIYQVAKNGHTEIVKILAPLTDNPNAPNNNGETPIHEAAYIGHAEIVKILAPLTDNPNVPNNFGETPIYRAALNGHSEIVKILAPLTDNPNAPDNYGKTPIDLAQNKEIVNILKSYKNSAKRTRFSEPSSKQSTKRPRKPFNYQLKINKK